MKIYTQADFDNFEIDEDGRRICPSGITHKYASSVSFVHSVMVFIR